MEGGKAAAKWINMSFLGRLMEGEKNSNKMKIKGENLGEKYLYLCTVVVDFH